jgi:hypothetical protein
VRLEATGDARPHGPFAVEAGVLRPIPDVVTEADRALARRFPWIRPSRSRLKEMTGLIPSTTLVRRHLTRPFQSDTVQIEGEPVA